MPFSARVKIKGRIIMTTLPAIAGRVVKTQLYTQAIFTPPPNYKIYYN